MYPILFQFGPITIYSFGAFMALAALAAAWAVHAELKRRGFRFVGPTVCYAFMQAAGLVNDHVVSCFRHRELGGA